MIKNINYTKRYNIIYRKKLTVSYDKAFNMPNTFETETLPKKELY